MKGKTMADIHEQRVMDGRTWEEFCDGLKAAGQTIFRAEAPATVLDRAEGWRWLTRLTRAALDMAVEYSNPDFPGFYALSNQTIRIGADNPDNTYFNSTISGEYDYKISGTRGSAPYLTFGSKANRYALDGTMATTGEINAKDIDINDDGTFEIIASQTPRNRNWLPLAPDSDMIIGRETFLDRTVEIPCKIKIERIDGPKAPLPVTAEEIDRNLAATVKWVQGTAKTFADWSQLFKQHPNQLPPTHQAMSVNGGGDPNIRYYHGYWELAPDEALVIESEVPECVFWNFQLDNYWMESLEYRWLPVWVNKHSAKYNPDGSVMIVIADQDPGVGNFIYTDHHLSGTMLLRWVSATSDPQPRCRVVKLAELKAA
jgi:hypothetical protein